VLIDTHCHLGDAAFADDFAETLVRAEAAGVAHVVVIGESRESAARALEFAAGDRRLSATAGVHPHIASGWDQSASRWLADQLGDPRIVAAGEMGLDYHYDNSPRERQRDAFDAQMGLAVGAGKPVVIHAREADEDVAAILRNHPGAAGVLHSWSSGEVLLRAGLDLGLYFSFSGMVTFRSWHGDDVIRRIPRDRILVETDAPYLAPVPHRGKRNEPAFVVEVARRIAAVIGPSPEEVERITTENAVRLFGTRVALLTPDS